jgi:hypothetical protein
MSVGKMTKIDFLALRKIAKGDYKLSLVCLFVRLHAATWLP